MKNITTRVITWMRNPSDAFVDGLLFVLGAVLKVGAVIGIWAALFVVAPALWIAADGDPKLEGVLIQTVIIILGVWTTLWTIMKIENQGQRMSSAQIHSVGMAGAANWHREDHDPETLDMIVLHEARHAVVADVLGYTVTHMTTRPAAGNSGGRIRWEAPTDLAPVDRRWAEVLISLAPLDAVGPHPQTDHTQAMSHLMQIVISGESPTSVISSLNLTDLFTEALEQTRAHVDNHHQTINLFAEILTERRELDGPAALEALETARITTRETLSAGCHPSLIISRTESPV